VENFYGESIEKGLLKILFMDDEQVVKLVEFELLEWEFLKRYF